MTAEPGTVDVPVPADLEAEPLCVVCAHQLHRHDRIGLRFCEATQSQALTRSCVCASTA